MAPIFTGGRMGFGRVDAAPSGAAAGRGATGGTISSYNGYTIHTFTTSGAFTLNAGSSPLFVEYVVLAGGGAGGGDYSGGGGAGGYLTGSTTVPSASPYTVQVGNGGSVNPDPAGQGNPGQPSYFGPIVAYGGGGGGGGGTGSQNWGAPGGSGGGARGNRGSDSEVVGYGYNPFTPSPILSPLPLPSPYTLTQGYNGQIGNAPGGAIYSGGGGGAGGPAFAGPPSHGGIGVQLPARFQNPAVQGSLGAPGPGGTYFWVAGGGGANAEAGGGSGGGPGGPYAGGGQGATGNTEQTVQASTNTGGGGGGGANGASPPKCAGGSGLVLVAYKTVDSFSATGGDVNALAPGNGYVYHTFTTPGPSTFTVSTPLTVDILMVGGGGSGGGFGGGGGAGGLIFYPNAPLTAGTYPVSVGAGGGISPQAPGSDTTFGTNPSPQYLIAKGGGRGSAAGTSNDTGGSGGGGSRDPSSPAGANQPSQPGNSGTYGFGNAGGSGSGFVAGGETQGGGGGGAGASGNAGSSSDGKGGAGRQYPTFTGSLIGVPSLNPLSGYFAGGGGGGREPAPSPATGGLGGGGDGGKGPGPFNGTGKMGRANSGGGGGGGGSIPGVGYPGAPGGSGIIIIRYPA